MMTTDADDCSCCAGIGVETPQTVGNAPGLRHVAYRIGTQPDFKSSLLARLSSSDYPALGALTARTDDDWTLALCDAFACAADVLTFYQERLVNEAFLRTANEHRSLIELARLIGYRPAPGVAASTRVAFTLETSPGQPALAARPVVIPAGTRMQSVPDPGQTAQTFETVEDIRGRVEWNALPAQTGMLPALSQGVTDVYVAGTHLQIQPGDTIALIASDRYASSTDSGLYTVLRLNDVEEDTARGITRLAWTNALDAKWSSPPAAIARVCVFRQRASLFGAAAPNANLVFKPGTGLFNRDEPPPYEWRDFQLGEHGPIDLDGLYPKIVDQSWIVLRHDVGLTIYSDLVTKGQLLAEITQIQDKVAAAVLKDDLKPVSSSRFVAAPHTYLLRVRQVQEVARSDFALSAKVSRITPQFADGLSSVPLRSTIVFAQSDEFTPVARPIREPVSGSTLTLGVSEPDLAPGQALAVTGKLQRVAFPVDTGGIEFIGSTRKPVSGESFRLLAPARMQAVRTLRHDPTYGFLIPVVEITWRWSLLDDDGNTVGVKTPTAMLVYIDALSSDLPVSEVVLIDDAPDAVVATSGLTTLRLKAALAHCYDRLSFAVNANVAVATQGETVNEIAGSGNAALANQTFQLRQLPLTYVSSASAANGAQATLQVRVNDLLWTEAASLYAQPPNAHVYALERDENAVTTLRFGDGIEGARLPGGQNNVRLRYRKGLGVAGNLRTGQLTTLLTRPLGVRSVINANDATGGQDPEAPEATRSNAPLPILTLERAVSAADYANYARSFAGIARACALWIGSGFARGVYLTVAGPDGRAVATDSDTYANLVDSLRRHGDPLIPIRVQTYTNTTFTLKLALRLTGDADPDLVPQAVLAALRQAFSFDARDFGQSVTLDELYAVIQHVEGVLAADISQLYTMRTGPVAPQPAAKLAALLPSLQADGTVSAAELLTLDAAPIDIGVMQ
ncbi:putative baseplate assembly protein [Paraburkholderia rhizosphaerae]|uniref:Putative phage baseplate assembly protein n=1 Tax=Paraburkholderia rhizosphaerae TaxID=480658 RepID=A0A4R8LT88_9BURK|nr:putative baseplate assembly protein [Paraburkholderia rhizosphaerae]TDY50903.1 putative phage baseplate assembly protein [Paraburkholderia rhizosphaerae]